MRSHVRVLPVDLRRCGGVGTPVEQEPGDLEVAVPRCNDEAGGPVLYGQDARGDRQVRRMVCSKWRGGLGDELVMRRKM